MIVNYKLFYCF